MEMLMAFLNDSHKYGLQYGELVLMANHMQMQVAFAVLIPIEQRTLSPGHLSYQNTLIVDMVDRKALRGLIC